MATNVYFLGKLFGTVVPDEELSADALHAVTAAKRFTVIRFPDGSLEAVDLDSDDYDLRTD